MTILKVLLGVLVSAACLIAFLAMTDEYERARVADPRQARVLEVREGVVRYEVYEPGSSWDEDGDGWVGPYRDEGVPAEAAAALSPGDPLVRRGGQLELSLAPPTKLLLVGVGLGILFALWSIISPILERRAVRRAQADPIRLFELMAKKTRTTKLIAALVLLACAAFIGGIAAIVDGAPWERAFLGGLALVALAVALFAAYGAWTLRDPRKAPVVRALLETPEKIVWVYEHRVIVSGVASHNLFLYCDDGQRLEFNLQQLTPEPLLDALAQRLPHAVFGYSPEHEARYRRSAPDFLRATRAEAA